jgi:hypothetical protein
MVVRVNSRTVKPAWDWEAWRADADLQIAAARADQFEAEWLAVESAPRARELIRELAAEYRGKNSNLERIAELRRRLEEAQLAGHTRPAAGNAPPATAEQKKKFTILFARLSADLLANDPNPKPKVVPVKPVRSGRSVDPKAGALYGGHLRASDGPCRRCGAVGRREVDHCHDHLAVRGLICRGCNSIDEDNMGEAYRANCGWCAWDIWLANELAR